VLPNPLTEVRAKVNQTIRGMILAAAAGAAGVAALFFFSLGGFLWLQQMYGTINASVALGGAYGALALVALIGVMVSQRSTRPAARPQPVAATAAAPPPQPWWLDPILLTTGLQVLRSFGRRSTLPLAIAAVAAGFVFGGALTRHQKPAPSRPQPPYPRSKPNGKGTFPDAPN
jgi:hypothetical protein